jgi:HEAT repeat protein
MTATEPSLAALTTRSGLLFRALPSPGESLVYAVGWKDTVQNRVVGTVGPTSLALDATVTLAVLVPRDGESIVELSVDQLRGADGDSPAELPPAMVAQTLGPTAHLIIHPDGALQSIRFPDAAQPGGRMFIQRLVGLLLRTPTEQPEKTSFGRATSEYHDMGPDQIFRSRVWYAEVDGIPAGTDVSMFTQELDSGALFTFGADGVLASLVDSESLRLVSDDGTVALEESHSLSIHLDEARPGTARLAPGRLASLPAHGPWESTLSPDDERKAVEARLEGLTGPILLQHLRAFAALHGKVPDQLGFFNRATGLLKLHPELSAQFVDLLHEPGMTYEGRAMALDLLASAGNDVVQAALVRSLRDPRTRALPEYVQLYQRIALVSVPSDATVAFAVETFERLHEQQQPPPQSQAPRGGDASTDVADVRTAAVYTLGSVAGHMASSQRLDAAEALCRRIVAEMMRGAGSAPSAYITALGNAGVPGQESLLLQLSDVDEPETRLAAINALRKYDDPRSRGRVFAILTARVGVAHNVDGDTQGEALRAAMLMTPTRADIQHVAAAVVKDTLHRDLYGEVLPLFRRHIAPLSDVSAALDAMFERSAQGDSNLQTRIDTLRAELAAQGP